MNSREIFQKAILERLQEETKSSSKYTGIIAHVTKIIAFGSLGADSSKIIGETTLRWSVKTDYIVDGVVQVATWHVTLYGDGNIGVNLIAMA